MQMWLYTFSASVLDRSGRSVSSIYCKGVVDNF